MSAHKRSDNICPTCGATLYDRMPPLNGLPKDVLSGIKAIIKGCKGIGMQYTGDSFHCVISRDNEVIYGSGSTVEQAMANVLLSAYKGD